MEQKIERQLFLQQFLERENNTHHLQIDTEFAFYNAVATGNGEEVNRLMVPLKDEQLGKLSDNPIRNLKYHLTITIALITRFCIEKGMDRKEAYSLSDVYIRTLDKLSQEDSIADLHHQIVNEYTCRMQKIKNQKLYSRQIDLIMDYIYEHLHQKINLDELAEVTGSSKYYMCQLFHKETGMTIGDYILGRKIEAAQNMLKFSDYSFSEIADILGFASQSHFTASFKKITGETPGKFKEKAQIEMPETL